MILIWLSEVAWAARQNSMLPWLACRAATTLLRDYLFEIMTLMKPVLTVERSAARSALYALRCAKIRALSYKKTQRSGRCAATDPSTWNFSS